MYDFDPSFLQEALKASVAKVNSQSLSPYLFQATRNSLKRVSEWDTFPAFSTIPALSLLTLLNQLFLIFCLQRSQPVLFHADCFKEEILIIVFALGFSKLLGTSDSSFCAFPLTLASLCVCPGLG